MIDLLKTTRKLAQSLIEYVMIFAIVAAALGVTYKYVYRSMNARLDDIQDVVTPDRPDGGNWDLPDVDPPDDPEPPNTDLESCLAGNDAECNQRLQEGIEYCCVECCGAVMAACNANPSDSGICNPGAPSNGCRYPEITNCQQSGEAQRDICCENKY
ncbi:MAG: hypothetical protein WC532_08735 [Candidatus Omnitrophota bacterium]